MRTLKPKERIKLSNQSVVYEAFGDDEKLTISEVADRLNAEAASKISEQTVRRSIGSLTKSGHLKSFGKRGNAQIFGKVSASFVGSAEDKVVPFGDELVSVQEFLEIITDPESRPLKLKRNLIGEKPQHTIRRIMAFVVLSSIDAGHSDALRKNAELLHEVIAEFEYAKNLLEHFVNSPIWYPQYRDKLALAIRNTEKENPELIQLARDYISSQRPNES